jgi:molybdopterin/thiamine biosynthesis adenylyltransferase
MSPNPYKDTIELKAKVKKQIGYRTKDIEKQKFVLVGNLSRELKEK